MPTTDLDNPDYIPTWEERREQHPQHVHSHYFRCQVCGEPFSELDAGRVNYHVAVCGYCIKGWDESQVPA